MSDKEIARELNQPHDKETVDAFSELAHLVVAHLPKELASKMRSALIRRLKPGCEPAEALCTWIAAHCGPQKMKYGFLALDWKAREEIDWQIQSVARSHSVELNWHYGWQSDESWKSAIEEQKFPVEVPLKQAAQYLSKHGLSLIVIVQDDSVFGFAIPSVNQARALELCRQLDIWLSDDA